MKMPKHYKLKAMDQHHYEIHDERDGKSFKIAKKDLDEKAHKSISAIPHYFDGTPEGGVGSAQDSQMSPMPMPAPVPTPTPAITPQAPEPAGLDQYVAPTQAAPTTQNFSDASQTSTGGKDLKLGIGKKPEITPDIEKQFGENIKAGEKAVGALGAEEVKKGTETAKEYKDLNTALSDAKTNSDLKLNDIGKQNDNLFNNLLNAKVDPDQYIKNMSTTNKIMSAIAIGLGGIGGGLAGKPNAALQILNDEIAKNVESQKANINKTQTLYSENLRRYGDERLATQATMANLNTIAQAKIAQIAAQHGGPIAQQNAQLMLANLKNDNLVKMQGLHQEMLMNGIRNEALQGHINENTDPAQLVQYLVPKEHQAKAFEHIEAAQNTNQNAQKIFEAFDRAANQKHVMDIIPGTLNADQKELHALLGPTFKDVEGTVRQAAMDNLFANATPQTGDNANTLARKKEALTGYINSKSSSPFTKGFGIDLQKFNTTKIFNQNQQYLDWAKQNPTNPKAKYILQKFGGQ